MAKKVKRVNVERAQRIRSLHAQYRTNLQHFYPRDRMPEFDAFRWGERWAVNFGDSQESLLARLGWDWNTNFSEALRVPGEAEESWHSEAEVRRAILRRLGQYVWQDPDAWSSKESEEAEDVR